jgi:hypothetical protein
VSLEDMHGGKLAAAMDRQHPPRLVRCHAVVRTEGITPAIRRPFVVYLASHNRPSHVVLFPTPPGGRCSLQGMPRSGRRWSPRDRDPSSWRPDVGVWLDAKRG